jgi:tetratricopeptide (TPR) repeat protein
MVYLVRIDISVVAVMLKAQFSGCGKSVMANFLSQNAQTPLAFAHFFRSSTNRGPTMTVSLAASILAQVLEENTIRKSSNFPQIVQHVVPLLDRFDSCDTCSFERLWPHLEYIFALLQDFTLLIDALDECSDAKYLPILLKRLNALSNFSNSRVILISRYSGENEAHLPHSIHLSMDEDTISPDIIHFIRKEIDRTPKLAPQRRDIISKVGADAQGMFLWAKLMMQYLKGAATPRLQRTRLDRFPSGLNAVYEQLIMEKGDLLEADELTIRKEIFLLLTAVVRPLPASEISTALALKSTAHPSHDNMLIDPENEILRLCWPLVMIKDKHVQLIHFSVREFLFSHAKTITKTNLRLRLKDSHRYMAQKCLNQLGQPSFASLETVAPLLRRNVCPEVDTNALKTPIPKVEILHEYACLYWHVHVVASAPDENLATQVSQFLRGKSFIAWAELLFHLKSGSDMAPVLAVRAELLSWHSLTPLNIRALIQMHTFFVDSYESVIKDLTFSSTDGVLPYLLLHRLGMYLNLAAEQRDRVYQITRTIMEGTETALGPRHPFTLRSVVEFAIEKINHLEYDESKALLWKVYEIQSEDLGVDVYDSFYTLSNYAYVSYYQLKLEKSVTLQEQASAGLLRTRGSTNKLYVKSRLYLGWCLEAQGHLDCALAIYENIWKQWATLYSPDNTLAMMAQISLSAVHRKKRNFKEAIEHGTEVFTNRQRVFGDGNDIIVDTALNLVILYRDSGSYNDARAMLDLAISLGRDRQSFYRICLIERLKACLQMDTGDSETASKILENLLHKASEDNLPNNRELLWARLSLADLLRSQGKNDEALRYFSDLVYPEAESEHYLGDFGDLGALHQLAIAEISTRCIMDNNIKEAHRILRLNGLRWGRDKDYWIPWGGPIPSI